jgi:RNA polymerase sigma-70 factor (ECF subfamily)
VALVRKLVAELPEKYRIPLYLNYSADMKASEIAGVLGIPLGTAKSRIRTAKAQVKERLEAFEYDR